MFALRGRGLYLLGRLRALRLPSSAWARLPCLPTPIAPAPPSSPPALMGTWGGGLTGPSRCWVWAQKSPLTTPGPCRGELEWRHPSLPTWYSSSLRLGDSGGPWRQWGAPAACLCPASRMCACPGRPPSGGPSPHRPHLWVGTARPRWPPSLTRARVLSGTGWPAFRGAFPRWPFGN